MARLPAAIFGVLGVLAVYFLAKEMFDERTGLIASALLAISPWHTHFSRWALQHSLLVFLFVVGLFFLYLGVRKDKRYIIFSAVPFALTFYTYRVAHAFVPLFILGFMIIFRKKIWEYRKECLAGAFLFLLLITPISIYAKDNYDKFNARFDYDTILRRYEDPVPVFFDNYKSYYTLDFLFLKGDSNQRHSPKEIGQLYFFELPLLLLGIILCLWKRKKELILLLYWLLIYPVPASLLIDSPHALRGIVALPMFQLISAYSVNQVIDFFESRKMRQITSIFLIIVIAVAAFESYGYQNVYFTEYPIYSAMEIWGWQYGMRDVVDYTETVKDNYNKILITHRIMFAYIFVLFYTQYDPATYQSVGLEKYSDGFRLEDFSPDNNLYVLHADEFRGEFRNSYRYNVKHIVHAPDGSPAYYAVEIYGES